MSKKHRVIELVRFEKNRDALIFQCVEEGNLPRLMTEKFDIKDLFRLQDQAKISEISSNREHPYGIYNEIGKIQSTVVFCAAHHGRQEILTHIYLKLILPTLNLGLEQLPYSEHPFEYFSQTKWAIACNQGTALKELIEAEEDPKYYLRNWGKQFIRLALEYDHQEIVGYLFERLDLKKKDIHIEMFAHSARFGSIKGLSFLLQDNLSESFYQIFYSAAMEAATGGYLPCVKFLVEHLKQKISQRGDLTDRNLHDVTMGLRLAAYRSAICGHPEIIAYLSHQFPAVDLFSEDLGFLSRSSSTLHTTIMANKPNSVLALCKLGVPVAKNTQKSDFFSPLQLACYHSQFNAVRYLCQHDADLQERTEEKKTPLQMAIYQKERLLPRKESHILGAAEKYEQSVRTISFLHNFATLKTFYKKGTFGTLLTSTVSNLNGVSKACEIAVIDFCGVYMSVAYQKNRTLSEGQTTAIITLQSWLTRPGTSRPTLFSKTAEEKEKSSDVEATPPLIRYLKSHTRTSLGNRILDAYQAYQALFKSESLEQQEELGARHECKTILPDKPFSIMPMPG